MPKVKVSFIVVLRAWECHYVNLSVEYVSVLVASLVTYLMGYLVLDSLGKRLFCN